MTGSQVRVECNESQQKKKSDLFAIKISLYLSIKMDHAKTFVTLIVSTETFHPSYGCRCGGGYCC
jgi:hypothetical protein